jgi:hypothetical protein
MAEGEDIALASSNRVGHPPTWHDGRYAEQCSGTAKHLKRRRLEAPHHDDTEDMHKWEVFHQTFFQKIPKNCC